MTESPWPESRRTQRALFVAGGAALVLSLLGVAELLPLGGTVTVLAATVASALLIYGLLGAVGRWFDEPADGADAGDAVAEETTDDENAADDAGGEADEDPAGGLDAEGPEVEGPEDEGPEAEPSGAAASAEEEPADEEPTDEAP